MAKVRYTSGENAGEVGYLSYHEYMAAMEAGTVELVDENDPEEIKAAEEAEAAATAEQVAAAEGAPPPEPRRFDDPPYMGEPAPPAEPTGPDADPDRQSHDGGRRRIRRGG
jgi:hypothetical protein